MKASYEKAVFETMPVPRAVMTLAVPTIISQIVTMIYNLGDTFFVGQIGNPSMVAAVTVVSPWFNLLTALGNLFGIGASSLISRQMGAGEREKSKYVSAFSFWGGAVTTLAFSMLSVVFSRPLLNFLGASADNFAYATDYLFWVVGLGGVPTMLGMTLAHLLRSEGHANQAGFGMMLGGVLNLILDPVFIFAFGLDVAGAAIATALSNLIGMVYFLFALWRLHGEHLTSLSLHPRYFGFQYLWPVFSVGLASALATTLGNISNMVIVRLASGYGDIPVAAYGIVKRLDQFPLNVCMGLCQGFMPLVGYNFAAKNYDRMRKISTFSWKVGMAIAAGFVVCFAAFAPVILNLFIRESETAALGTNFLRIACLAVPLTAVNFLISYTLQAMGLGVQSAILTFSRQGLLNVPLLILMNWLTGLYGMIWVQLMVEVIMLPVSLAMYFVTLRRIRREEAAVSQPQKGE